MQIKNNGSSRKGKDPDSSLKPSKKVTKADKDKYMDRDSDDGK